MQRPANRLGDEASHYLRSHAHDPVDWYPWGPEALARARQENKPIFLSSGYAACHWCHVMQHEVFAREDVAAALGRDFVSIKVDREERPDIDGAYMQAVLLMTGSGGWPMSVFLTPDLEPFHGATYVPAAAFLDLLARIARLWRERPADLRAQASAVATHVLGAPEVGAPGLHLDASLFSDAIAAAAAAFDDRHGGLQARQKFPVPVRWAFLLHAWRYDGAPRTHDMVAATLDAIVRGGLRDHLGGGFHRYTVDATWTVPHFEKMLYDNAQLAALLLEAGAAMERTDLVQAGRETLDFLLQEMRDSGGAFCASFDADSGGDEGSYYVWSRAELQEVCGPDDGSVIAELYGVTEAGNFEQGRSVLTRRQDVADVARRHGRDADGLARSLELARAALLASRRRRTAPARDPKVVTAWNGLALSALAAGWAITGHEAFREAAGDGAAFLRRRHRRADGTLWRASTSGETSGEGVLDDYALLAGGLLDLFQITGEVAHLAWTCELVDRLEADFARPEGGFYETRAGVAPPLGRRTDPQDGVIPSGGSAAVRAMIRLGALQGDADRLARARAHLGAVGALLRQAPLELAGWLDAALLLHAPLYDVVISGDAGDPRTRALVEAIQGTWPPQVVMARVPASGPGAQLVVLAPAVAGKSAGPDGPLAYVCRHGACLAPAGAAPVAAGQVRNGWRI